MLSYSERTELALVGVQRFKKKKKKCSSNSLFASNVNQGGILVTFHCSLRKKNRILSAVLMGVLTQSDYHKIVTLIQRNFIRAKCKMCRKLIFSNVYKTKGFKLGKRKEKVKKEKKSLFSFTLLLYFFFSSLSGYKHFSQN